MSTMHCDIVSAEQPLFSGAVEAVFATGTQGELGIFPGHTALLSALKPGPIELRIPGEEPQLFYASGGYLEVQPEIVTILADVALRASDLDEAAALRAQEHATQARTEAAASMDYSRAAAQLAEAAAQLRTLRELRKKINR